MLTEVVIAISTCGVFIISLMGWVANLAGKIATLQSHNEHQDDVLGRLDATLLRMEAKQDTQHNDQNEKITHMTGEVIALRVLVGEMEKHGGV